jgi:glycosyltransferase involved in cell wall biosynthesis
MAKNPNKQSASSSWSDSSWRGAAARSGQYSSWRNRNTRWSGSDNNKDESSSLSPPELHKVKSEVPVVHFAHAGFLASDSRVMSDQRVAAAPYFSFMISRALFLSMSGFNSTALPNAYFDADLCLRLQTSVNLSSYYVASSSVVFSTVYDDNGADSDFAVDNYHSDFVKPSLANFTDTWQPHLSLLLQEAVVLKNLTLVWAMDCGAGQVLGFTTEATNIIASIHTLIRTKIIVSNSVECKQELRKIGFPVSTRKLLHILEERDDRQDNEHLVAVLHKDPGRYSFSIFQEPFRSASYLVGRSMYETTSIPAAWVQPCNTEVDAIWVPTEFNRATFTAAGVNSSLLSVVPEAIDHNHFDPSIIGSTRTTSPKLFNFLSISKWEKRKGWDILLTAFFTTFKASDPVMLTFRSNMNAENMKQYSDFAQRYATSHNVSVDKLPRVEFIRSIVPYGMLPFIYKSSDAFVLASHGEGWGLPLMEAMSMELPTIATNWSGNTAFMTTENSFLVAVDTMAAVDGEQGHSWAVPAVKQLAEAMKTIFEDRTAAARKGKRARRDLLESEHLRAVPHIMALLEAVQPRLDDFKRARESKADQNMWSNTFQYSSTSGGGASNSNAGWSGWSGSSTQQTFVDSSGRTRMRVKINQ